MNIAVETDVIYQCLQTVRAFNKSLNNAISKSGIFSSEWTIMHLISDGTSRSQTDLARELGVEAAAISKTLAKLQTKELIEKYSIPGQRGKFIRLTRQGQALMEPISRLVEGHRMSALTGISEAEQETLLKVLKQIETNVSQN